MWFEESQLTIPGVSRRALRASSVRLGGVPLYTVEFSVDGGHTWTLAVSQSVRLTRKAAKDQGWLTRIPKPNVAPRLL